MLSKALKSALRALCFISAATLQAAIIYENPFSGSETGPTPALSATAFTETLKLPASENPWVSGLMAQKWPSGNRGAAVGGTYAGWFKANAISGQQELFRLVGNTETPNEKSNGFRIFLNEAGQVAVCKTGESSRQSAVAVSAGSWFHVAVTIPDPVGDSWFSGDIRICVNGSSTTVGTWNDLIYTSCQELWIGSAGLAAAQVRIDSSLYSADDVLALMYPETLIHADPFSGPETGPSAALPSAATLTATQKLTSANHPWITSRILKNWTGNNSGAVNTATCSGWFKVGAPGSFELFRIVGNAAAPDANHNAMRAYLSADGKVSVTKVGGTPMTHPAAVNAGEWFHLAVAFTTSGTATFNSHITLYLNGDPFTSAIWNDLAPTSGAEFWIGSPGLTLAGFNVYRAAHDAGILREIAEYTAALSADTPWSGLAWSPAGVPGASSRAFVGADRPATLTLDQPASLNIFSTGGSPLTLAGGQTLTAAQTIVGGDLTVTPGSAFLGAVGILPGSTLTVADPAPIGSLALAAGQNLRLAGGESGTDLTPFFSFMSGGQVVIGKTVGADILRSTAANQKMNILINEGGAVSANRLVIGYHSGSSASIVVDGGSLTLASTDKTYSYDSTKGAAFLGNYNTSPANLELRCGTLSIENGVVNLGRDATGVTLKIGADPDPARAAAAIARIYGIGTDANRPGNSAVVTLANGTLALGAGGISIPAANTLKTVELTGPATLTASEDWTFAASHAGAFQTKAAGAAAPAIDPAGHTITLNAALTGSGGIRFAGTGTVNLNGGGTYTGGTAIEGAVNVKAASIGTGGLTLANATFNLGLIRPPSLSVTAASTLSLTLTAGEIAQENAVILSNVTEASPGLLTVIAADAEGTRFGTVIDGTDLRLAKLTLTWNGSVALPNWDTTSQNWLEGSSPTAFMAGADVIFPENGFKDVVVAETVAPSSMTVFGEDYTFSGESAIQAASVTVWADTAFTAPVHTAAFTAPGGSTQTLAALAGHPASTARAKYIKLTLTGHAADSSVAVAELALFNGGDYVPWPAGSTLALTEGNSSSAATGNEGPGALIDGSWGAGNPNNKLWIANPTPLRYGNGQVAAIVTLPAAIAFNGYRLCTADHGPRNPAGWQLHGSMDGENWTLLDAKTGQSANPNTWYGDPAKAVTGTLPAAPATRFSPLALNGAATFSIGTLSDCSIQAGALEKLTLTGNNSAFTGGITLAGGVLEPGSHATMPKALHLGESTFTKVNVGGNPVFAALNGAGTLELQFNAEAGLIAPGVFSGLIRQLAPQSGSNPKLRLDTSRFSTNAWIEAMSGAQLWGNVSQTRKIRIAGEGGAPAEPFGGALRLQSTETLAGQIELMDSATVTGNGRTLAADITLAQSLTAPATLRLGVAFNTYTPQVDGNLTLTGTLSGREGIPLNLLVNAHTVTFKKGTGADIGSLTIRHRAGVGSSSGQTPAAIGAVLTADAPSAYTYTGVEIGGGPSGKTETLTVGTNATLAVTGALAATESDSKVIVAEGGALANVSGTIEGTLELRAGSTLRLAGNLLTAGSLALPAEGTVALDLDPGLFTNGFIVPLVKASTLTGGPAKNAFTGIPEKWQIGHDPSNGLYLRKTGPLYITLY